MNKNLVLAADLDGTLAESKQVITAEMAETLSTWLETRRFAIISGGGIARFHTQVVDRLSKGAHLENLYLFPTNGATCFTFKDGSWVQAYENQLNEEEKDLIFSSIKKAFDESGILVPKIFGEQIEYRGGQVTFSALGQEAPLEEKAPWDPDQEKRKKIVSILKPLLPGYSIGIAGASSIDVTREGIDKAYALNKMMELLSLNPQDIVFYGDALFPGGNDYAAIKSGVECIRVTGPSETIEKIRAFM